MNKPVPLRRLLPRKPEGPKRDTAAERSAIEAHVAEYLKRGGVIQQIPVGVSGQEQLRLKAHPNGKTSQYRKGTAKHLQQITIDSVFCENLRSEPKAGPQNASERPQKPL